MYPRKTSTRSLVLSALGLALAGVTVILFGNSSWGFSLLGSASVFFVGCCVRWWESRNRTSRE